MHRKPSLLFSLLRNFMCALTFKVPNLPIDFLSGLLLVPNPPTVTCFAVYYFEFIYSLMCLVCLISFTFRRVVGRSGWL